MAKVRVSSLVSEISGGFGGIVIGQGRSGAVARRRPVYRRPTSPGQAQAEDRMRQAVAVWGTFTAAQAEAWAAYAATLVRHNTLTGEAYSPIGYHAFTGLATKFLQMHPSGVVPTRPPVGSFAGDSVSVSVALVPGGVEFLASGPNAPGILTELLVQELPNVRRKPTPHYRSVGFVAFAPGSLSAVVPLGPGVYVAAYRFCESATGRQSLLMPLPGVLAV